MNTQERINQASLRLRRLSVSADHIGAICDAGQSLGEARVALADGENERAVELVVLAEEQLESAEREPE